MTKKSNFRLKDVIVGVGLVFAAIVILVAVTNTLSTF